jgi:hypothetical protein
MSAVIWHLTSGIWWRPKESMRFLRLVILKQKCNEANHVWVLAEISPDNWIAMETTGGFLICNDHDICPVNNQLYYHGWSFDNPGELKEALEIQRHPCPDGYILGSDQLCHPACGGAHYCTGNSICINGECMGCSEGYIWEKIYYAIKSAPRQALEDIANMEFAETMDTVIINSIDMG